MPDPETRRPLASRQTGWAQYLARRLAGTRITPNRISQAGMVAALLSGACFWAAGVASGGERALALLAGAAFCQFRLLCNLLDGMVAIEAGRAAPDGAFWNELPDRVADALILVGLGLGLGVPALGWAATSLAFLTAYIRELGARLGQGTDFSGPMAKPHRMAAVTGAAVLSLAEPLWQGDGGLLLAGLWIITIGTALTALRRGNRLVAKLRG
ncbi:MAG: CDP-alcohol phosphatidyltransferase family protein [Tropicimonas sp.]|uniref:CDP-alcohol phosphatidyltransferase family protein n=1 Tax=Tropicimonas sp. TaxID=2067044 RepID=UPI003A855234